MNGVLSLNKPSGPSSYDLVRLVKRLTKERRVGHGGTLDPSASGVLPILVGQATRLSEYLLSATKAYRAEVCLGVSTDTYDAEGKMVSEADPSGIDREQVQAALAQFRGVIRQRPPMYSALKREGKRLYELAREGIEVEREAREIEVYRIDLTEWRHPQVILDVECSRGTYVRSLAHDLGEALGCGAHLAGLVRTRAGPLCIEDALSVEVLFEATYGGYLHERLEAMDVLVTHLPAAILGEDDVQAVRQGQAIPCNNGPVAEQIGDPCRAFDPQGDLVAMLSPGATGSTWRPRKVFPPQVQ